MSPAAVAVIDANRSGLVELEVVQGDFLDPDGPQLFEHIYNTCLARYGKRHKFMGFLDLVPC